MKKPIYNFIFNLGQLVKVKQLNLQGRISGLFIDGSGITYRVRYFFDSKPNEVYFQDDELELIEKEEEKSMTFKT